MAEIAVKRYVQAMSASPSNPRREFDWISMFRNEIHARTDYIPIKTTTSYCAKNSIRNLTSHIFLVDMLYQMFHLEVFKKSKAASKNAMDESLWISIPCATEDTQESWFSGRKFSIFVQKLANNVGRVMWKIIGMRNTEYDFRFLMLFLMVW